MEFLTLKDKRKFQTLIKEGKKLVNTHFVVYYLPSLFFDYKGSYIGISVGKKLGNAVTRNFYKRRIRHILRDSNLNINNFCVIVIMRPSCCKASFGKMQDELNKLLKGVI